MKRFITMLIALVMLLSATATANGLLIVPNPNADPERKALLESLHRGIIPVADDMTREEFFSYLDIIDDSEDKMHSAKLELFFELIGYYYYENMSPDRLFSLFAKQVDEVDINNMEETYKALFSCLDRFSYYLTPSEATSFFNPTSNKGIGIKMVWRDAEGNEPAGIYVDEVAKGSPAELGGIRVGDRIVEFDGKDMRGLGFQTLSVYNALVPTNAETLEISLERDGEVTEYTLNREGTVFAEYLITLYPEKSLIYLDINSFMNYSTAVDVSLALDEAWSEGYRNIILDLQSNSGGDVVVATEIMSKFFEGFEILFFLGRDGSKFTVPFVSKGNGYDFDNIKVLVDGSTASVAEIFADTLGKWADADIIGQKTFGKGVAQSVFPLVDGSAVGITTYVAYDREGETYNEKGITPTSAVTGKLDKNALPKGTPVFTALNYKNAVSGAENATVLGLEIRLEALGYLADDEVDRVWGEATTRALSALQTALGYAPTGSLDEATYFAIMSLIGAYENTYYYSYTPFDYAYRFIPYN